MEKTLSLGMEFFLKPHPSPLLLGEGKIKSLLLIGGDLEEVLKRGIVKYMETYIIYRIFILHIINMSPIRFNPYKSGLIDFAKTHRKQATKAETLFWSAVRNRKILWYKFKRETAMWNFILDFYCSELLLWIEIDGWYHDEFQDYDDERTNWLYDNYWIKIIRFTNDEIEKNLEWVIQYLEDIIKDREKELWL